MPQSTRQRNARIDINMDLTVVDSRLSAAVGKHIYHLLLSPAPRKF